MTTKYLVLSHIHDWHVAYFVSDQEPAAVKDRPFPDAYQQACYLHKTYEVHLVPRISFIPDGQYYRRIVDSIWNIDYDTWCRGRSGKCSWVQIDDSTRLYIENIFFMGWIVELTNDQIKELDDSYPSLTSDYYTATGEQLATIVIPNKQKP